MLDVDLINSQQLDVDLINSQQLCLSLWKFCGSCFKIEILEILNKEGSTLQSK